MTVARAMNATASRRSFCAGKAVVDSLHDQMVAMETASAVQTPPTRCSSGVKARQVVELLPAKNKPAKKASKIPIEQRLCAARFIQRHHPIIEPARGRCYTCGMGKTIDNFITDFLEHLEVERGRSQQTIRNYDFYLCRFADFAKHPSPEKITDELVHKFRLWLNRAVEGREAATLKKSTQNYHLIALRSFLKYLARKDIRSLAPEKIELARQEMRQVEFLEGDELDRLLAQPEKIGGGLVSLRDRAILELLFSTGMRVSELCALKIENVNLARDEFTVRGKGGKLRVVFLSSTAKEALKDYLAKRRDASPYLFVGHDRAKGVRKLSGLTPRSIQRLVERYARAAGITKHITPHTLRHTFATDLLMGGADIRSVQSLLGHASITTTQIYTHITNRQMKDVHKKFHGRSRKSA